MICTFFQAFLSRLCYSSLKACIVIFSHSPANTRRCCASVVTLLCQRRKWWPNIGTTASRVRWEPHKTSRSNPCRLGHFINSVLLDLMVSKLFFLLVSDLAQGGVNSALLCFLHTHWQYYETMKSGLCSTFID